MSNWVDIPVPDHGSTNLCLLDWAKAHCPTYVTNDGVVKEGRWYYRFYFGDSEQGERDRVMFALRWA